MQSFLQLIAQHLIKSHKNELGNVAIVLPNRRANIFLRNELSKEIKDTTWAPSIYSLEDFVEQLVKLTSVDQVDLTFELYEVHKEIEGKQAESFDEFMNWGAILLYDFNEIDRYLVNAEELYGFLSEARAIETWNPETGKLTAFQEKYLKFWDKLHLYYTKFRKRLIEKGLSYQGLSFRQAAENVKDSTAFQQYDKIYFAGFNALTEAEKVLLNYFRNEHGAELIFDSDNYYLDNKSQESGRFLREHKESIKDFNWQFNYYKENTKEIDIYGISGNIGQAKLVGNILTQSLTEFSQEKTAVVLSDENLLVPILDSLPAEADKVNVTMGYTLSNTIFFDFFDKYLKLFLQNIEEGQEKSSFKGFYFKDCLELLNHPVWKFFHSNIKKEINRIQSKIEQSKVFFIQTEFFDSLNKELGLRFFENPNVKANILIKNLLSFCEGFHAKTELKLSALNSEILYSFYSSFNRINQVLENTRTEVEIKGLYQLYKQVVSSESVSFIGEPLSGLQVMGVLETRTLDFEHVIVTSVNEGVLPSGKTQSTFIPYDIKRKFNLPSYKEKDSIFAYHFYRLLQRAKKVSLIHNTFNDGFNSGEKSRFILQIENELQKYNSNIKIKEHLVSEKPPKSKAREFKIESNENIRNQITNRLQKGISPSALNSFFLCPLNFYNQKILGLNIADIATEELELNDFGKIVHLALENLYKFQLNKVFDKKVIQDLNSKHEASTLEAFKEITNQIPETGNYKLAFEIAKIYVKKIINLDAEEVKKGSELIIKSVEFEFVKRLEINHPIKYISIKGIIDRVDSLNGVERIIDYKTGGVNDSDLKLSSRNINRILDGKHSKLLQMMVYWLAMKEEGKDLDIGIFSTKNELTEFIRLQVEDKLLNEGNTQMEIFKEILEEAVEKLLNPDLCFVHNLESDYCDFC